MGDDSVRTGVCVVRAERDPHAGLRVTVTQVLDLSKPPPAPVRYRTASIDTAVAQVRMFLQQLADDGV